MNFTLRPFAGEFEALAQLLGHVNSQPMTAEQLETAHSRFPADAPRRRMVAEDEDGTLIGYANTSHAATMKPGLFWVTLVTAPLARRQGVATALLADLAPWVRTNGGTAIETGIPDDDAVALAFAAARGARIRSTQITSSLSVPTFDEAPWAGVVEHVERSGIRFFTLAERPGEETLHQLYDLYKITDLDTPGYAGVAPENYPPFADWYDDLFGDGLVLPEGFIIAADGERFIGCTIVQKEGDGGAIYTEYTGVLREYRGRQIGLALKLLSVRFARRYGAPYMTTKNDSTNLPMLAINNRMGYVKTSGRAWLTKVL